VFLAGLVAAGTMAACGSASAPVSVPGAAGNLTITRGALEAVEAHWPSVQLGTSRSATCPSAAGAPTSLLQGDFDGDGSRDAVLWITTAGTPRLVAVFSRLNGEYLVADLGDQAAASTGLLEIGARGTPYHAASLAIELHYGVDTVVLRECAGAATAYLWTGSTFRPEPLAN
jgi:hypothetical protein